MKRWARFFFVLYAAMMLWLLFDRSGPEPDIPYWQQIRCNMNLDPFHTIQGYWNILTNRAYYVEKWGSASVYFAHARIAVINLIGNVIMFVPLGYFVPTVWVKCRSLLRCLLVSALMIVCVEILQLFTLLGSCDVDDLILNLVGVILGYGLCRLSHRKKHRKRRGKKRK